MLKPDLIGHKFNRLTVIAEAGRRKHGHVIWLCRCECGNETRVTTSDLRFGTTVSCGCYRDSIRGDAWRTHGLRQTPVGGLWNNIIRRCYNPKDNHYKDYGGRGICMCESMRVSPLCILTTIGQRPEGMQIDRIDVNGNYSCGQCAECVSKNWPLNIRWVTPTQQARNKRNNRMITISGETKCVAEWAEKLGIKYGTLHQRLKRGRWKPEYIK